MQASTPPPRSTVASRIAVIAITAALYTVGKALTGFIPTPWGIGQFLIGVFIPAYFAVVADTLPVAIGAGIGTFVGDVAVLTPLGETTPTLSLVAGVPANFVGFLLFGWFVKKYKSWSAFVAATVCFVTLGNLIAAVSVVEYLVLPQALILGLTVYWNTGAIPAVIIGVPILLRATRPLLGRSSILRYPPVWTGGVGGRQTAIALIFSSLFVLFGAVLFLGAPSTVAAWSGLASYFAVAAVVVVVFGPIASVLAGSKVGAKQRAG